MKAHLSHELPWESLVKIYNQNLSEGIRFPICECDKMHIVKKSDEIKVGNRKYIKEEQICRDPSCKEIRNEIFYKNKNNLKFNFDTLNAHYSYYKKTYHTKIYAARFIKEYSKVLNKFADDYLNKLKKMRTNKQIKKSSFYSEYNREDIENYKVKKIKEYFLLEEDSKPKWYSKESVHDYGNYGSCSDYEYVYALISSEDDNDIIFLLNEIDRYKKNKKKRKRIWNEYGNIINGLNIGDVVTEWGTQCFGRYARYLISCLNDFYLKVNIIIASGNFYNKEVWEKLQNIPTSLEGDFHSFIPKWIDQYFYKDKLKIYQKNYQNAHKINLFDCIKISIDELLKKIFRYNSIWLALYKYSDEKKLAEERYKIFLDITDLGYYSEDFDEMDNIDVDLTPSSNLFS